MLKAREGAIDGMAQNGQALGIREERVDLAGGSRGMEVSGGGFPAELSLPGG